MYALGEGREPLRGLGMREIAGDSALVRRGTMHMKARSRNIRFTERAPYRSKGSPVIPKRRDERRGAGDFYVDKTFRCRGDRRMCGLYRRRTASERMNSRAERLIGRNTLRGLSKVGGYVGVALTLMLLIAAASYRNGKPELARSIEYYASH